jgi:hypothetical protein
LEEFICKKCGLVQTLGETDIKNDYLPNGGYQQKFYCSNCKAFLKNHRHSRVWKFYFGKYRGKPISVVAKEDASYLKWLYTQNIRMSLKESIEEELKKIENKQLTF